MSKMFPTIYICDVKNSGGHLFRVEKTPPRPPEKTPGGESFDSLSPWTPTLTDQEEGDCGPPLLGTLPKLSYFRLVACDLHFVAGLRARGHLRARGALRSKPAGLMTFRKNSLGGFPKGRGRSPCPLVVSRESPRGEIEIPPRGFFGGLGAFFAPKNAPKRPPPPLWWRNIGHS